MNAGTMLREARVAAGLTQRELARRAGVPQPAVSRIERDHGSPRVETLDRLLRACGKALELTDRPGVRVDRTLIRERLAMTPGARARRTALEWNRTASIRRRS
ncbi:MAG TPA: helix-turn-helix transcriptional regulator [Gaiellaceae bacterium]|jgi:transcriptional regulator with XRE-family HTH domain